MQIGSRLKEIREAKNLSQGDIEKRTGLVRCYTSRVEHGHTVPSVETWKNSRGRWKFRSTSSFTKVKKQRPAASAPEERIPGSAGETRRERHLYQQLIEALARMEPRNRDLLLMIAEQMVNRKSKRKAAHH